MMRVKPRAGNAISIEVEDAGGKKRMELDLHEDGDGGLTITTTNGKDIVVEKIEVLNTTATFNASYIKLRPSKP